MVNRATPLIAYLDVCCLQRPFDDQRQARVRLESEAVLLILARAEAGDLVWATSDVVDYEIDRTPNTERAFRVRLIASRAERKLKIAGEVVARATEIEQFGFAGLDALHLASAESGNADLFLTTDDKLLKRATRFADDLRVRVVNPLDWSKELDFDEHTRDDA